MRQSLAWVVREEGEGTLVVFTGAIDESVRLESLASQLSPRATFDLGGVVRVTSEGVRRWVNFIRSIPEKELSFIRCSLATVTQMNLVAGFRAHATVRSFFAPYGCEVTGKEELRLLTCEQVPDPRSPPTFPCEGGVLELQDIPERYFDFLLAER